MPKQFPEFPVGREFFPKLLPWALRQQRYTNEEARAFCAVAFGIPEDKLESSRFADSEMLAWPNYVAHALKLMTQRKLHLPPARNDGVHYLADEDAIRAYLTHEGWDDTAAEDGDPLIAFLQQTRSMPTTTEAERFAIQRIGQDIFRAALVDYWGCCPVTEIDDPALLRASH